MPTINESCVPAVDNPDWCETHNMPFIDQKATDLDSNDPAL